MKLAIMMRAMDQDSGLRALVEGLIEAMLTVDRKNSYVLMYRTRKWLGRFKSFSNAKEILISAPHKLLWDQVAVPYTAWNERAEVIFNPKFSVPLISHCPVVMGLQEPAWWAWPKHYEWLDRQYMRAMLPLYCRRASRLFAHSNFVVEETRKYLQISLSHAIVTPPAPKACFRVIDNQMELQQFRDKYDLPERFLLSVTRVDHPGLDDSTTFFPGKNLDTTIRAFMRCRDQIPVKLVIAGRRVREYLAYAGFTDADLAGVQTLGFVPHEQLPCLFNLADLFVIPSFYEGFGLAAVEAMACGCPVIGARSGAIPEVTGGAAELADPYDPGEFAQKIRSILADDRRRRDMRDRGLARAKYFNWERAAKITLEQIAAAVRPHWRPLVPPRTGTTAR